MAGNTEVAAAPARTTSIAEAAATAVVVAIGYAGLIAFLKWGDLRSGLIVAAVIIAGIVLVKQRLPKVDAMLARIVSEQSAVILAVTIVALTIFPALAPPYWIHVMTMAFLYAIMVLGLNIQLGEIGAANIGYAGLFAVGAYSSALLSLAGVSFWLTIPISVVLCFLTGGFVGLCILKTRGDYLALVTLGFGLIIQQLIINLPWLTHGTDGVRDIPMPSLFTHRFSSPIDLGFVVLPKDANFYYLTLLGLGLSAFLVVAAKRAWIGRVWIAVRRDSLAISCFGVNVPRFTLKSFAFGSAFAGIAGPIYAHKMGFIGPEDFSVLLSITLLSMVILGGMGNWIGVLAGTTLLVILPEKFREIQDYRMLAYGMTLVLILIYRPYGLFPSADYRYGR